MDLHINDVDLEDPKLRKGLLALIAAYEGEGCAGTCGNAPLIKGELGKLDSDVVIISSSPFHDLKGAAFTAEELKESRELCPLAAAAGTSSTAPEVLPAFGQPMQTAPAQNPAAVAPAPPAPAAPTTSVATDKNGLPWDARIHSESKAFIADGSWRRRRGVADELVAQVEQELRGVMGAPVPPLPQGTDGNFTPAQVSAAAAQPWPFPSEAPPPPAAAADPLPSSFAEFIKYVSVKRYSGDELQAATSSLGLPGVGSLSARPDMIPAVLAKLPQK